MCACVAEAEQAGAMRYSQRSQYGCLIDFGTPIAVPERECIAEYRRWSMMYGRSEAAEARPATSNEAQAGLRQGSSDARAGFK
jgi:hypothetical protein